MRRNLFLIGLSWMILAGSVIAAEPGDGKKAYDPRKVHEQANQIEADAKAKIDQAGYPGQVIQIFGWAQLDYSRLLMRQQDEIIRQNDALIRQNEAILQLLREMPSPSGSRQKEVR